MVRAGVLERPSEWEFGGYTEIQNPKQRYTMVNRLELTNLLGIKEDVQLLEFHRPLFTPEKFVLSSENSYFWNQFF